MSGITVTDMFCGAGGSSQGAAMLGLDVKWAMNHWQLAVDTHQTNFPGTSHDCADISASNPLRYASTDILIASPECVNHSAASGRRPLRAQGELFQPYQADPAAERSRATMWDVPRFAEYHNYNIIVVENVPEARKWVMWDAWIHAMQCLGYEHEVVYFNSMFAYPTPQSRDRMYVVFWKRGNPAPNLNFTPRAWCYKCQHDVDSVQSWKNPTKKWGKYKQQYIYCCPTCGVRVEPYYYCAYNVIDWSLPTQRIGDRKRPLADKTVARIEAGLRKFKGQPWPPALIAEMYRTGGLRPGSDALGTVVAGGNHHALVQPFLAQLRFDNEARSLGEAVATLTSGDNQYLVEHPPFLFQSRFDGDRRTKSLGDALQTVAASGDGFYMVRPPFMVNYAVDGDARSMTSAINTQTAIEHDGVVIPPFTISYYSQGEGAHGLTDALGAVTTNDRNALITPPFMLEYYGRDDATSAVTDALATVPTEPRHAMVMPPFLSGYYGGDEHNTLLTEGAPTFTASTARQALIMPFLTDFREGENRNHALTEQLSTVVASVNSSQRGMVQPASGEVRVEDCHFRMLTPPEIKSAMAFGQSYVVLGTKADQIKQLGNAVTPPVERMILERCIATLQ